MASYSGMTRQDYMTQYQQGLESNAATRKLLSGGNGVPVFSKDPESTENALVMAQNQARMDALKTGGSKKKTKHKQKYSVQHKGGVKVRVNSKKRRNTRKKDHKKHR
jgi:hypothetical protein